MIKQLIDTSIKSAINQDWQKAIDINQEILTQIPDHIPTLNRLANAYHANGDTKKAVEFYQKVLKLDKYNTIAQKAIRRIINCPENTTSQAKITLNFIEEPGSTKTTQLVRLAEPSILATLMPGEIVSLKPKNRIICVYSHNDQHIGALTDDIAYHLRQYIDAGYTYTTAIKSISDKSVTIFIKEVSRTDKLGNSPTFAD